MIRRPVLSLVAVVYFATLVALTFTPGSEAARSSWLLPLVLFVPVGLLLCLILGPRRWWAAVAFGVLGAAWVEAAQTIWMPAGYASGWDLAAASAGTVVGVAAGLLAQSTRVRPASSHGPSRMVAQAGRREIP